MRYSDATRGGSSEEKMEASVSRCVRERPVGGKGHGLGRLGGAWAYNDA